MSDLRLLVDEFTRAILTDDPAAAERLAGRIDAELPAGGVDDDGPLHDLLMLLESSFHELCESHRFDQALLLAEGFEDLLAMLGLSWPAAEMAVRRGEVLLDLNRLVQAEQTLRYARDLIEPFATDFGGTCSHLLASALSRQERSDEALSLFREAAALSMGIGSHLAAGESFEEAGRLCLDHSSVETAEATRSAADAYRRGGDHESAAAADLITGWQEIITAEKALTDEDLGRARRSGDAALAIAVQQSLTDLAVAAQVCIARAIGAGGDLETTVSILTEAVEQARTLPVGDAGLIGNAEFWLGNSLFSFSRHGPAESILRSAHHHLTLAGDDDTVAATLTLLAQLAERRADHEVSRPMLESGAERLNQPRLRLMADRQALPGMLAAGDVVGGIALMEDILARADALDLIEDSFNSHGVLSILRNAQGNTSAASAHLVEARRLAEKLGADVPMTRPTLMLWEAFDAYARNDRAGARQILVWAHELLVVAGAVELAGYVASTLAVDALKLGHDAEESAHWAIPAMVSLGELRHALPSSAERQRWNGHVGRIAYVAFEAVAGTGDPALMAELISAVHAQSIPEPADAGDASRRPLESLLAVGTAGTAAAGSSVQSIELRPPSRVQMPWGELALARYLEAPAGTAVEAVLVVPR